ncbi:MAG: CidA/LrgA family protein [Acidobacteriaceae bacterium]
MLGFVILVGFQMAGAGLHRLGAPLPGSVLGLVLFTFALAVGWVKLKWVERTANLLTRHMTLLFLPLMASLPAASAELRHDGVALVASVVVSLLAVLFTTGGLTHLLLRRSAHDAVIDPATDLATDRAADPAIDARSQAARHKVIATCEEARGE